MKAQNRPPKLLSPSGWRYGPEHESSRLRGGRGGLGSGLLTGSGGGGRVECKTPENDARTWILQTAYMRAPLPHPLPLPPLRIPPGSPGPPGPLDVTIRTLMGGRLHEKTRNAKNMRSMRTDSKPKHYCYNTHDSHFLKLLLLWRGCHGWLFQSLFGRCSSSACFQSMFQTGLLDQHMTPNITVFSSVAR